MRSLAAVLAVMSLTCLHPRSAEAQERPRPLFDGQIGGVILSEGDAHRLFGGRVRWYVNDRVAVGPEVQVWLGERGHYDVTAGAVATLDVLHEDRRAMPYLLATAGVLQTSGFTYNTTELLAAGGVGLRVHATDRLHFSAEARLGFPIHGSALLAAGWRF